jgi:hypothetical protein
MDEGNGRTYAQCKAFSAKLHREQAQRTALLCRLRAAETTLSLTLDSLTYLQQYVAGVEALVADLLAQERALPPFRSSAFMRELVMENYVLWPEVLYGPYPLTVLVAKKRKEA